MGETDLSSLLKITDPKDLRNFLDNCIDELAGINSNVVEVRGDLDWMPDELNRIKTQIQKFYRQCTVTHTEIALPEMHKNEIMQCFERRKTDIFSAIAKEDFIRRGHNLVETFDWKLKWILGSSKYANFKQPLLQMDLYCLNNKNNENRSLIEFEMNPEQLDDLIKSMDNALKELQ